MELCQFGPRYSVEFLGRVQNRLEQQVVFLNFKLNENSKLKTGQKKYFSPFIESNNTDL